MRRRGALTVALATVLALPAGALGAGATYDVVQCHSLNRGMDDAIRADYNSYTVAALCADARNENAAKIRNVRAASRGAAGTVRWRAPAQTTFVGVTVKAKLRREKGHRARLFMADGSLNETSRIATGDDGGSGFLNKRWTGTGQRHFVTMLDCARSRCPESDLAKVWFKNVRMTLADLSDPEVGAAGNLLDSGWHSGREGIGADTTDIGSGIARLEIQLNGTVTLSHAHDCAGAHPTASMATSLVPCSGTIERAQYLDTESPPFREGENAISICGQDFAGNATCLERTVLVDNLAPELAFTSAQDPDDPELVRARLVDPTSGVAWAAMYIRPQGASVWQPLDARRVGDHLQLRVDSSAYPPGAYEFMASARDVAGNEVTTTQRADGSTMTLAFPLRSGVDLSARLLPGGSEVIRLKYGRSAKVGGLLISASGVPLAGRDVVVDEFFGEGALIDHRIRTVTTDSAGRWQSRLPAGPTRSVSAAFAGDARYVPGDATAGRLVVRTGANFKASSRRIREGRQVRFKGRIGRLGARIPARGKLVQLQYQEAATRRWFTVRNAFYTDSTGGYRFPYRFGTHYLANVAIRFRLRVLPERGWPYQATTTRARRVTVLAR